MKKLDNDQLEIVLMFIVSALLGMILGILLNVGK